MDAVPSIDIVLVDDHEVVRSGLKAALGEPYRVVADVADGAAALRLAPRLEPDVVIVDMRLPDIAGPTLCARLRKALPRTHLLVLSGYEQEATIELALRSGACHYVSKSSGFSVLRRSIEEIANDEDESGRHQHAARWRPLSGDTNPDTRTLTETETQVLELAAQGFTDRQIGRQLFLAESTVRFHLQRLKSMLGAKSRTEAVAKAIRMGILAQVLEA